MLPKRESRKKYNSAKPSKIAKDRALLILSPSISHATDNFSEVALKV